jgi:hypothetical protein
LIHSLRTIRIFWRMASPVQVGEDGGRKFDVKDASWASEMTSDRRRLLLKEKSLPVCPFPTIGLSDAGNNALQAHRLSISVHPVPLPMLAEGGRLAGRSSVSPQVAGARKRAATVLARREKARAYGTTNACLAGNTKRSFCAYCWFASQTHLFSAFLNWKFGFELRSSRSESGKFGT